ncbi:hypothetical protein NPIL_82691 [Nephila pilipes]|uniref:Uncharacterized protein n=1 Tax=Nephila pilipes TaxID=299642 RepID=A0A8X6PFB0_NEPPI|nr:hypothetical protein NPIL_82691 [Nephila pilipes]
MILCTSEARDLALHSAAGSSREGIEACHRFAKRTASGTLWKKEAEGNGYTHFRPLTFRILRGVHETFTFVFRCSSGNGYRNISVGFHKSCSFCYDIKECSKFVSCHPRVPDEVATPSLFPSAASIGESQRIYSYQRMVNLVYL